MRVRKVLCHLWSAWPANNLQEDEEFEMACVDDSVRSDVFSRRGEDVAGVGVWGRSLFLSETNWDGIPVIIVSLTDDSMSCSA